jgi:hypothetical protein
MANKLNEQLSKMRTLMKNMGTLNEASVGADGSLDLSFNPLESVEMLTHALMDLKGDNARKIIQVSGLMTDDRYNYMYSDDQKMGMVKFSKPLSKRAAEVTEDVIKSLYYAKGGRKDHQLTTEQILELINYDIQLINKERQLKDELVDFEELLVGAFGDDILLKDLSQRDMEKIMNPYADLKDFGKDVDEPVLGQDGSLSGSHNRVPLDEPVVNYAKFEAFVEKNPQYKAHYEKWSTMLNAHTDAMLAEKKAGAIYGLKEYKAAYQEVQNSQVTATIAHAGLYDESFVPDTAKWVAQQYFTAKQSGQNTPLVQAVEQAIQ